jgi:SAM-dependent methyltransferase
MLAGTAATYLTEGLASLRSLPSGSADLIWSQAVLEHVRLADLDATMVELRRIIRPGGVMSHEVDFRDHLGGNLNSLRFTPERWEGPLFSGSGFYTNRVRMVEMIERFRQAGFRVECRTRTQWDALPTARADMDPRFATLGEDDLLTSVARLVMYPS